MKRITLLALLVLAASSCVTTTQPPGNANANANSNASASPSPSPRAEANTAADTIIAREKEIWETIRAKNPDGFAAMLADDFIYVTDDGVYDRAGTTDGIKQLALTDLSFADWKVITLDKDAAVVVYTVNMKGTSGGQPLPGTPMRAGSLWANRGGKWMGVYHQDTAVEEPPPAGAAADKTPAPAATPDASKPAEPAADDPVEREKQIWDAIKKRDYDRFGSFLAEDQLEVFAWGVNDKAASLRDIRKADLSSAVLSDFRTVKVDDDAVVVRYLVKGSGDIRPAGERHSTVWVKRDGKWLAAYHQATTVKAQY
ncbi:MAG TPA: nuclear transport factor 2 family protein [Pyrinomonadaceae bacterium]|nr:nuclear transport factor 2 family protein [Pyrinomonadaceae bacterium]